MEFIKTQLILDPEQDQQAAGKAECESEDVYKRKALLPVDGAKGGNQVIANHEMVGFGSEQNKDE
jgi:hypothetical protein